MKKLEIQQWGWGVVDPAPGLLKITTRFSPKSTSSILTFHNCCFISSMWWKRDKHCLKRWKEMFRSPCSDPAHRQMQHIPAPVDPRLRPWSREYKASRSLTRAVAENPSQCWPPPGCSCHWKSKDFAFLWKMMIFPLNKYLHNSRWWPGLSSTSLGPAFLPSLLCVCTLHNLCFSSPSLIFLLLFQTE